MGARWVIGLCVVVAACGGPIRSASPIDAAIQNHAGEPGMVEFLNAGRDIYESPRDVDQVAAYFKIACVGYQIGFPEPPETTVRKIGAPPWSVTMTYRQAQELQEVHPALCS